MKKYQVQIAVLGNHQGPGIGSGSFMQVGQEFFK